jgi:hypothetical protein
LEELNRIGIALSETRDVGLLRSSSEKRGDYRGGCRFAHLVERESETANRALRPPRLRFKLIQNDSVISI